MLEEFSAEQLLNNKNECEFFQKFIYDYYVINKRNFLWRSNPEPYYVLISEIMSQQTQIERVEKFFKAWIDTFPTIKSLACASFDDVLRRWMGLGYNRRALFLHRAAQEIVQKYDSIIPTSRTLLKELPGIGDYTSGSILAFAYDMPEAFIDTNIRSVFIALCFPEDEKISDKDILPLVECTLDKKNPREWYYALMDYGAYLKATMKNPSQKSKHYTIQSRFHGSQRQCRALVLRLVLHSQKVHEDGIINHCKNKGFEEEIIARVIKNLHKEQLILYDIFNKTVHIKK